MNMFATRAVVWIASMLTIVASFGPVEQCRGEEFSDAETNKEAVSPKHISELIQKLGNDDYYTRQQAQEDLARLGFEAFDQLDAAADHADPEIASRARYLLRLMRVEWISANDPPEVKRCLENYELESPDNREMRMRLLARLSDGQGVAALCRLVRFEKSAPLSKAAAVAFLTQVEAEPPKPEVAENVLKKLRKCKRPAAEWMRAWTRLASEPEAEMDQWSKIIEEEHEVLKQSPKESTPRIVSGLVRFQVEWLARLDKEEEASKAIRRLVQLEKGESESLAELLDWMIERKAWQAVDDLARRFSPKFAVNPELLYMLAEAYAARGDKKRAEQNAARALKLKPGKQKEQLYKHLNTAYFLRFRGNIDWARREYEHVIQQEGKELATLRAGARLFYAEMLHDQNENLDAAKLLEQVVKDIDAKKVDPDHLPYGEPHFIRGQMNYFFALHWEAEKNLEKQRESLENALKANPEDSEVLIACYRLPNQSKEYREKIAKLIENLSEQYQTLIDADPDVASSYNQSAWLACNTGGDLDQALKYSLKSVELEPESGAYYDTLAHVYFAKGDFKKAVETQTKAVELYPFSGVIRAKLELFRAKLKEQKGQ